MTQKKDRVPDAAGCQRLRDMMLALDILKGLHPLVADMELTL